MGALQATSSSSGKCIRVIDPSTRALYLDISDGRARSTKNKRPTLRRPVRYTGTGASVTGARGLGRRKALIKLLICQKLNDLLYSQPHGLRLILCTGTRSCLRP